MRRTIASLLLVAACLVPVGASAEPYVKITDVRVAMDDGVLMAADVYVPTVPDADGDGLYPCVVELTPYRKETRAAEGASLLPAAGIVLIEVDARGTGGSAGEYDVVFSVREQADAAAWVEWAALSASKPGGAPLCERTVGMYGGSYSGIIQSLVASLPATATGSLPAAPPHLAAIAPQRAYGDLYRDIVYHGGQLIGSFGDIWSTGTTAFYTQPPSDVTSETGARAWLDHLSKNDPMMRYYIENQYADAVYTSDDSVPSYSQKLYEDSSVLPRIGNLRVPALQLAGFFDTFTRGQLLTFSRAHALERSLGDRGPNFLIAGPWNHSGTHFITPDQGFRDELLDWYGYWLEGKEAGLPAPSWIEQGFDGSGGRALYFQSTTGKVNGATPADGSWRTASTWPPPSIDVQKMYLGRDREGLLADPRSGELTPPDSPDDTTGWYWISNPAAGTGELLSRWDNAASGSVPHPQWDQRTEDGKGLTFTSSAMATDLSIAGPISLNVWASVTGTGNESRSPDAGGAGQMSPPRLDTDFVVKLSDVAPDGTATLVTQGYLRASHRAYDPDSSVYIDGELMAPYHLHTEAAVTPPEEGTLMRPGRDLYNIEIWPTAKTFAAGHKIRLDIYSADTPNHMTIVRPTVNGLGGGWLSLPVVDG